MEAETVWAGWGRPNRATSGDAAGGVARDQSVSAKRIGFRLASPRRSIAGGLTGWLLTKLRRDGRPRPQLAVIERISLAPKQSLTLIEAGGQRLLVATSADGTPAFYPVYPVAAGRQTAVQIKPPARVSLGRVSW